jgi:hypothetical protein
LGLWDALTTGWLAWTELECWEMDFNGIRVYSHDQRGYLDLTDPFVILLMELCRTSCTLSGVMWNWFR